MRHYLFIILPVVGIVAGAAFWPASSQETRSALYLDTEVLALGQELYLDSCASCHGVKLEGEPDWQSRSPNGYLPAPPHDETGHTWHHPTEQLFAITKLGTEAVVGGGYKSNMIGFGDVLSDDEIYAILAYIKSTWPDRIIDRHNQMDENFAANPRP